MDLVYWTELEDEEDIHNLVLLPEIPPHLCYRF